MKLVENKAELIQQNNGINGLYDHIKACVYNKNDDSQVSSEDFVKFLIENKKYNELEFGTVYLAAFIDRHTTTISDATDIYKMANRYQENPYSIVCCTLPENDNDTDKFYITTNYRVLVENNWLDDLKYLCSPTENHVKRFSFKLTTSIGVSKHLYKYKRLSLYDYALENPSSVIDKSDNQVLYCKPSWLKLNLGIYSYNLVTNLSDAENGFYISGDGYLVPEENDSEENFFLKCCLVTESRYKAILSLGEVPTQAMEVLPLSTATTVVCTGFLCDLNPLFDLHESTDKDTVNPSMIELVDKMVKLVNNE